MPEENVKFIGFGARYGWPRNYTFFKKFLFMIVTEREREAET